MYSRLGFSVADVARFLQVTPRTVHAWISGRVRIPFAAYKLLRVQLHYELPGDAWNGWCLSAGRLYTPEGHELRPHDFTWWGLLVRKAAMFSTLYAQATGAGRTATGVAGGVRSAHQPPPAKFGPTDVVGRPAQPAGPNSFLEHFRKWDGEKSRFARSSALETIAKSSTPEKEACVALRRVSSKKQVRKAKLLGHIPGAAVISGEWSDADAFEASKGEGPLPELGRANIAADLRRLADALPSGPTGRPGRPKKGAEVPLTRQQRRYRDRMISKAAEAWDKVTDGAGVVLVGGKPVDPKGGA